MMIAFEAIVCLRAVCPRDFHFSGESQLACPLEHRDLVFLHQVLDALGVFQHHLVFALLHIFESELNSGSLHTKIRRVLHLLVDVGRHQHLLGGNTTAQGAGAAEARVLFDHCDLQAELARADRRHVAAWATSDNSYVKLFTVCLVCQCVRVPLVKCEVVSWERRFSANNPPPAPRPRFDYRFKCFLI